MGRVDYDCVNAGLQQSFSALERIGRNTNSCRNQQMTVFVNGSAVEV